jgi:hypothetical protein
MASQRTSRAVQFLADSRTGRKDLRNLSRLSQVQSKQLFEMLLNESELIAAPSPATIKIEAMAKAAGVDTDTVLSLTRMSSWLISALDEEDVKELVDQCQRADLITEEDGEGLSSIFSAIQGAKLLRDALSDRANVAAVMPTFWDVQFACDLRAISSGEAGSKRLIPVSIIRIRTDEGEAPFVFQCTAADLDTIAEALDNARKLLVSIKVDNANTEKAGS